MSIATISYSSLKDSAREAKAVAKKCDTYADRLNSSIYKKLVGYSGTHTGNIETAKRRVTEKITELEEKSTAYTTYSQDLTDLKKKCVETDKAVKSMVSQLTATFKEAHGIKNSAVTNLINYCLTALDNSTFAGRWISNMEEKLQSFKDYIKQWAKEWWNYKGGEELVRNVVTSVLACVATVCIAVAAVLSGGWIVATIAAIVLAVITVANTLRDIGNEIRAYLEINVNNDPALGARRSNENTWQDTLRRESDSQFLHNIANIIDVTTVVCTIISVVDSVGKLLKNGFKWATNNPIDSKNLKIKDILSKDGMGKFFAGLKDKIKIKDISSNISQNFTNIKNAIKAKDWKFFKDGASSWNTDFLKNLKYRYWNGDSLEKVFKSIANVTNATKDVVKDGLDLGDVLKNIVLPTTMIFGSVDSKTGNGSAYDFYSIFNKSSDLINNLKESPMFPQNLKISEDTLSKLSQSTDINITIPDIYVPEIKVPEIEISKVDVALGGAV